MKKKQYFKNIKRFFAIVVASTMLMSIPVVAYGGNFSFNLTFNSDNDNAQSDYAYRDETMMGNKAYVTVTKQSNANNNIKFKALKYNAYKQLISGVATAESTYSNTYYKKNLSLSYKSKYESVDGEYVLYGRCTKSDASASGNWRP